MAAIGLGAFEDDARFRLLVSAITDYAIYLLEPDGTVASWNTGAERMKGYAAEDVIGRHFSLFYIAEDRAAGLPQAALATALAEGTFTAEGLRQRRDGTRFPVHVTLHPIRDADGVHVGFAKITRIVPLTGCTEGKWAGTRRRYGGIIGERCLGGVYRRQGNTR